MIIVCVCVFLNFKIRYILKMSNVCRVLRGLQYFDLILLDMVNSVKPDERSVMAYVSSYYHAFSGAQQVNCLKN